MRRCLFFILLIIPIVFFGQDKSKIIVGGDFNYPPYSFIDENGNVAGYDIDVINAISKITGLDIGYSLTNWDSALLKLKRGDIDIIASIVYSSDREKIYDFSFPLHTEYYAIFSKKSSKIEGVGDLALKKPAILIGDISNELFFKPMGLFKDFIPVKSFPEALALVHNNKCDYVIVPYPLGMKVIHDYHFNDIEVKGQPIIPIVYCLAVQEGDYELLAFLNQGIEILSRNGELDKIYNKWIKYKRAEDQYENLLYYSLISVLILVSIIIILLLFWYSLKKQVNKKAIEIKEKEHINYLKLQEAKKEVDIANKAKSRFLSSISHEIRTPLFAIIGFAELMVKTSLSKKQLDYSNKIALSGQLLLNLVNDILDITQIEAEKLTLNLKPFDLKELIFKVYNIESINAIKKNIELVYEIDRNLPVFFIGDELRLFQILLNVLNNAIKFTDKGKVSLLVKAENLLELDHINQINVHFIVRDTGIGIPLNLQKTLFKPFVQIHNVNKRKYRGTGLGLAISKQLIDIMGGKILVESTEGKGSVFNISIPLEIYKRKIKSCSDEPLSKDMLEKTSVLLVEDNSFNAEILIEQLTSSNFLVTHAVSGFEAIDMLKKHDFHIIIMDIEMPEMDGFKTFEKIKQLGFNQTPVIALSAHNLQSDKEKAFKAGMLDYLCKPVSIKTLSRAIYKYKLNSKSIISKLAINRKEGLAFSEGNFEKYNNILLRFKKHYNKLPEKLMYLFTKDFIQLKEFTHNLKSAAKTIGAIKLAEMAEEADELLRNTPNDFTQEKLDVLVSEIKKVLCEIEYS